LTTNPAIQHGLIYERIPAHRHPNGGGWVADEGPQIEDTVFIDGFAKVIGNVKASGKVEITGTSVIRGESPGSVTLQDSACIQDSDINSTLCDIFIGGSASIENSLISGNVRASGHVRIVNSKIEGGTYDGDGHWSAGRQMILKFKNPIKPKTNRNG